MANLKQVAILIIIIFHVFSVFGQPRPSMIQINEDAPEWVHLLNQENPNVLDIKESYTAYYKSHPFIKNSYTQYYKRFMRWARPFMDGKGRISIPDPKTLATRERNILENRKSGNRTANWTFAGPNETWHTDGTTKVTWQTNIYSLDIAPSNANILYAGGESGGLWKTTDKGLNWSLKTKDILHGAFGAVKVHPTNPDIVYAGTSGKLIKSIDGGTNWTTIYTETDFWANEIAISASNPNIVIVASNQGLLRTTNGGSNWTKLFTNEVWTVKKKESSGTNFFIIRKSGTNNSEFMSSTDSGATWTVQTTGWWQPNTATNEAVSGAIIATCPSSINKIYAYLCGNGGALNGYIGVFVSVDGGVSWNNANGLNLIGGAYTIPTHTNLMAHNGTDGFNQGFYDMAIVVNPSNSNELIAGGTSWFKSTDGGATWNGLGGYVGGLGWSHPDIQWCAASGSDLWIASDGGLNYSPDFGQTIEARMNGISGADMWGFGSGWNTDILVGGRYHNGNMAWHESFPAGKFYRMGGAEAPTGYVNPGPSNKVMHSDIGGHKIKSGFGNGVDYFSVGAWPNESYAYFANSDMTFHPNYYNTIFIGKENTIMKSTDGGTTFSVLYTFPGTTANEVFEVQIARSNPNIMYCSQWNGTDDALWKSTNAGISWSSMTALPLPNNNDRVKMAVSSSDPNIVWVAVSYGSNGKKIYKTTNGGTSWVNMTSSLLNGITITNIMAQYGTDGGIYLGTNAGVFYRNNSHTDWQPFSTGLPVSTETNRLKPFYRDNKIRNGCWGFGVWESPLFETSLPEAMPTVSAKFISCLRDTVYFDDYSVLNHDGASWHWSFPGASYISDSLSRNPKVLYPAEGAYDVTLTITNGLNQSSSKTIPAMITIENKCSVDTIPGKAIFATGSDKHGYVPDFNLEDVDSLTVTAWIKPSGIQPDYSAIFMGDGTNAAGFNLREGNNTLGYHWPAGAWYWDSNIIVPSDQWSFVAMVVKPTGVTLYCNEQQATHNFTLTPTDIPAFRIGSYRNWGSRNMNALIDEVAIYDRPLSTGELRDIRHLTKYPENDSSLIAYYQFNSTDTHDYDKIGTHHILLTSGATKEISGAPVGGGTSQRITISSGGLKDFSNAGMRLYLHATGTYPNGEVVVTRINQLPNIVPSSGFQSNKYWILNNYGSNANFSIPDSIKLYDSGNIFGGCYQEGYGLRKRTTNSDSANWTDVDNADHYNAYAQPPFVTFGDGNVLTSAGQLYITLNGKVNGNPTEICNGIDDNCNGLIDESYSLEVTNSADAGANTLRAILNCAQNGETITFAANVDTITLLSPLKIQKNITLIDAYGSKVVIRGNLSDPGYNNAEAMIIVEETKQLYGENIEFRQLNNSTSKPIILNKGHFELTNSVMSGDPTSIIKHALGSSFEANGVVEIK